MDPIGSILFEPVGCLAEFPVQPFQELAVLLGRKRKLAFSTSRLYWHLLEHLESAAANREAIQALEMRAVEEASLYEDVVPAFTQLRALGIPLLLVSSLSDTAITRFAEKNSLAPFFTVIRGRETAGGMRSVPLRSALEAGQLAPEHAIFLTDTAEGLEAATQAGVRPVLMMNDPDESKRLAQRNPAGGVVSLLELPDFVRFLLAQSARGGNR